METMEGKMDIPIDKNRKWVAKVHQSIDQLDKEQKAAIMKQPGLNCAFDLLTLCEGYLGRQIGTITDLVDGWNILRDPRNLKGRWKLENGIAHGIFGECGCPLVRSGLIELHPVQCLCSQGMTEMIFSRVAKRTAKVAIRRAIGKGDDICEFVVNF
jgi:hypothetical protein